jgi:hypothetical protein
VGVVSASDLVARLLISDSTYVGDRSMSGSLLRRTSSKLVNAMIKYDFDATASYAIPGLRATSPRATLRASVLPVTLTVTP